MSELRLGTLAGLAIALGRAFGRARAEGTLSTKPNRQRLMQMIEDEAAEAYHAIAPPKHEAEQRRAR